MLLHGLMVFIVFTVVCVFSPLPAMAQQSTFLGVKTKPLAGVYLVLKDVNVRARPQTKSKRVGRLKRGDRVDSTGRAPGPWIAVRVGGKDFGFVFKPTLMLILEGALDVDLKGELKTLPETPKTPPCSYVIHFDGKSPAEGQPFEFADYEVRWRCGAGKKSVRFLTPMYMAEGSTRGDGRSVYQITIDILELGNEAEDQFSTNMWFNKKAGVVSFDTVNVKGLGTKPAQSKANAVSVAEALRQAVVMAHQSWTAKTWVALMGEAG